MSKIDSRAGWAYKKYLNEEFGFDYAVRVYLNSYPFMKPYYNQYSATWTTLYKTYHELRDAGTVHLRDGALSLLKFIKTHSEKIAKTPTHYLIDQRLDYLVPEKLINNFSRYEIVQLPNEKTNSEIIFSYHVDNVVDVDNFLNSLKIMVKERCYKRIYIYQRSNEIYSLDGLADEDNRDYEILLKVSSLFKNCDVVSVKWLLDNVSKGCFDYYEWNPYSLYFADSFFFHQFATSGNNVLNLRKVVKSRWSEKLSPYHGMIISDLKSKKIRSTFNSYLQQYFDDSQFELEEELNDEAVGFEEIQLYSQKYVQTLQRFCLENL